MSFSFFKPSRPKTPQEVAKAIKDSLMALDTKTVVEVKALEKVSLISSNSLTLSARFLMEFPVGDDLVLFFRFMGIV